MSKTVLVFQNHPQRSEKLDSYYITRFIDMNLAVLVCYAYKSIYKTRVSNLR